MADCIRSLLIICSHLKELFIVYLLYLNFFFFFQLSPMHFSSEPERLKYLSVKRGKGYIYSYIYIYIYI